MKTCGRLLLLFILAGVVASNFYGKPKADAAWPQWRGPSGQGTSDETNLPAQLFFKSVGFRAVSVLRKFYEDTPEDAYLMQFCCEPQEADLILPMNRIDRMAG